MAIQYFENGMTVRQLKDYVNKMSDTNEYTGEDNEVWLESEDGRHSNVVKMVCNLNMHTEFDSDILLGTEY